MKVLKFLSASIVLQVALVWGSGLSAYAEKSEKPNLQCMSDAFEVDLSGETWLAHACDDGETLVFVTPVDNAAHPFVFMSYPKQDEKGNWVRQLYGEGNGNKAETQKAFDVLSTYTVSDFDELHAKIAALDTPQD